MTWRLSEREFDVAQVELLDCLTLGRSAVAPLRRRAARRAGHGLVLALERLHLGILPPCSLPARVCWGRLLVCAACRVLPSSCRTTGGDVVRAVEQVRVLLCGAL